MRSFTLLFAALFLFLVAASILDASFLFRRRLPQPSLSFGVVVFPSLLVTSALLLPSGALWGVCGFFLASLAGPFYALDTLGLSVVIAVTSPFRWASSRLRISALP